MRPPVRVSRAGHEQRIRELPRGWSLDPKLEELIEGSGPWELEIGFGKGRYLLRSAADHPQRRFLGIEVVSKYYRLVKDRGRRHGLDNLAEVLARRWGSIPSARTRRLTSAGTRPSMPREIDWEHSISWMVVRLAQPPRSPVFEVSA